jgi:hypothetical protein
LTAEQFSALFEARFAAGAEAAGLIRSGGQVLKWTRDDAGGHKLAVGFRLNHKNVSGFPGEFMPDFVWDGPRSGPRDEGEVSVYQYTSPEETAAVSALQKRVVQNFVTRMRLEEQLKDRRSLVRVLADSCDLEIRPNHNRWLPYWRSDDATAWGTCSAG